MVSNAELAAKLREAVTSRRSCRSGAEWMHWDNVILGLVGDNDSAIVAALEATERVQRLRAAAQAWLEGGSSSDLFAALAGEPVEQPPSYSHEWEATYRVPHSFKPNRDGGPNCQYCGWPSSSY